MIGMRMAVRVVVVKDDALLVMHRNKFGQDYYTLIGGAIKTGETPLQALNREISEEASIKIVNPRLIYIEQAGDPYGTQYIFLCDYDSGQVALSRDSEEAKIHLMGKNLFRPEWLPINELPKSQFISNKLKDAIIQGLLNGFPSKAEMIM
jgi:8-oxo-dGTP pyrophosphatase MutT (NUDIX family)